MKVTLNGTMNWAGRIGLPLISVAVAAGTLEGQPLNPHAVQKTPSGWVASPDLDGDGEPDLVLVDREDGVIRAAVMSGGQPNWVEPVSSGMAGVQGVAVGPMGPGGEAVVAVTQEAANRINVFDWGGSGLSAVPEAIFPPLVGVRELSALPEGSAHDGGPASAEVPWEMLTYSELHDPTGSGALRKMLRQGASGWEAYGTSFETASAKERGHSLFWVEEGLPMLGLFGETGTAGVENFVIVYTEAGDFEPVSAVPVTEGAEVVHASFDGTGEYQFIFHVPGSAQIEVAAWDGSALNMVGTYSLTEPAAGLFPYANGASAGLLAIPMAGGGLREYAFDGGSAPVSVQLLSTASGLPVTAALAREDGSLLIFSSGEDSGQVEAAELFEYDGSQFNAEQVVTMPVSPGGKSTILFFGDTPFVNENPQVTGRWQKGVWTAAVSLSGSSVEVTEESFGGPVAGLGNPVTQNLGSPPAGTVAALGNQVGDDVSLHDPRPALGGLPVGFEIIPGSGEYADSVTAQIVTEIPSADVFYRQLPNGGWQPAGGTLGPFYEETELQIFATASGQYSPIETVHYAFREEPGELDSDGDGVPDFVEIANGLDPILSEDDADGDGFSDFMELMVGTAPDDAGDFPLSRSQDSDGDGYSDFAEQLAGTDPNNAGSVPSGSVLNLQSVFDLVAVPYSHDGSTAANPFVPSLDEALESPAEPLATPVRLFNLAGGLIGYDRTRDHGIAGVGDPSALLEAVSPGSSLLPMVVSTGRNFAVDVAAADQSIGRQIAALVKPPELAEPEFSYSYGSAGGSTAAEAAAWVSSVKGQLLALEQEQTVREFDLYDTLVLLLTELRLEQILKNRDLLPAADRLTLTGFRSGEKAVPLSQAPGDGSRPVQPDMSIFREIQREYVDPGNGQVDTGFRLGIVMDAGDGVIETPPNGNVTALRQVAEGLYRVSAAQGNVDPGALLPPMEALRRFIRTGSLADTGYPEVAPGAPFDGGTLAAASDGVAYVLALGVNRPVSTLELTVTASTDGSSQVCTVLLDETVGQSVSLVDFKGNPYALPDAFELPAGSKLSVRGYTDVDAACGADLGMEVIPTMDLVALPTAGTLDANGNLIPDDLEDLYTSSLSAFGDSDGDGFSDLQEILDGTDPSDPNSFPGGPVVNLGPPSVSLTTDGGGNLVFEFNYPAGYADDLAFELYAAPDLNSAPVAMGLEALHGGSGEMSLSLPQPASGDLPQFWMFQLSLD